jgi:endo-1,4-beta-xylanase
MGNGGATAIGGRTGAGGATTATGGATSSTGGSTGGPPPATKKFFGNIDTQGQIRSDFKTMWDQFSPENAGKWGSVQGSSQSSFNWNSLDAMYKYCSDNNIIFKQHNFTWGAQQPGWVNSSNATAAIQNWMTTFCQRYPKTAMIDVVNEPLHNQASYTGGIGGAGSSGYDWIVNVFKWARTACPNAILIVNDYNTIEYSNENNNIQKLVKAVVAAGGPIDAVGNQGHDVAKVSASTVLTYTNNIINGTGLPVYITEMDIGLADDNQQQQVMQNIVTELWNLDKVKGFTYWGYIVGTTWRSNTGLMTSSGTKRAALTWLLNFLGR